MLHFNAAVPLVDNFLEDVEISTVYRDSRPMYYQRELFIIIDPCGFPKIVHLNIGPPPSRPMTSQGAKPIGQDFASRRTSGTIVGVRRSSRQLWRNAPCSWGEWRNGGR